MTKSERLFFELLKSGIWNVPINNQKVESEIDWDEIFHIAKKQSVVGVVFDGVQKISKHNILLLDLLMEWYGQTEYIEMMNRNHNKDLASLVCFLDSCGINSILLKGSGCGHYYPIPKHRQCGDIDIFVGLEQYEQTKNVFAKQAIEFEFEGVYDAHLKWGKTLVELHKMESFLYFPALNKRFQHICRKEEWRNPKLIDIQGQSVTILNPTFNVFYIFVHLWHHFLQVGVGLRQICDWIIVMKTEERNVDWELVHRYVMDIEAKKAWMAFYGLAVRYIGLRLSNVPEWMNSIEDKNVEVVYSDIMKMGNFGKYGESMQNRTIGKGFWGNIRSYLFLVERLARVYSFGPKEVIAYPLYKLIHGVKS